MHRESSRRGYGTRNLIFMTPRHDKLFRRKSKTALRARPDLKSLFVFTVLLYNASDEDKNIG